MTAAAMAVDVGRIGIWCSSRIWPHDAGAVAEAAAELEALGVPGAVAGHVPVGTPERPASLLAAALT